MVTKLSAFISQVLTLHYQIHHSSQMQLPQNGMSSQTSASLSAWAKQLHKDGRLRTFFCWCPSYLNMNMPCTAAFLPTFTRNNLLNNIDFSCLMSAAC